MSRWGGDLAQSRLLFYQGIKYPNTISMYMYINKSHHIWYLLLVPFSSQLNIVPMSPSNNIGISFICH